MCSVAIDTLGSALGEYPKRRKSKSTVATSATTATRTEDAKNIEVFLKTVATSSATSCDTPETMSFVDYVLQDCPDGPVMNPPVMNPPVMNPPVMNPPVMNPPVINPPVINPPVINPPVINPTDEELVRDGLRAELEHIATYGTEDMTFAHEDEVLGNPAIPTGPSPVMELLLKKLGEHATSEQIQGLANLMNDAKLLKIEQVMR